MTSPAARLLAIGLCLIVVCSCAPREGIHAVLSLDMERAWRTELERITDTIRTALRRARLPYRLGAKEGAIVIGSHDPKSIGLIRTALQAVRISSEGIAPVALEISETDAHDLVVRAPQAYRDKWTAAYVRSIAGRVSERIHAENGWYPLVAVMLPNRIAVDVPGDVNTDRFRRMFDHAAKMEIVLVDEDATAAYALHGTKSIGVKIVPFADERTNQQQGPLAVRPRPIVTGANLAEVLVERSPMTGEPIVSIRLDAPGTAAFAQATRANVGGRFALVLDEKVVTAPVVRSPILGGGLFIDGGFTPKAADDLAFLLKAGMLSPGVRVMELRIEKPN
jgi:protein-export membrane protein SecD